jgi:hypothetical protein
MRALRTLTLLIALASTSTAHAQAQAEAGPAPELSAIHAEKLLAYYNELVDHAVKHAADCGALAGALDGVVNRHLNTIQMTWAARKAKKVVPKDVESKLDARRPELIGGLRGCWADARVKAVFQRMKPPAEKKS